MSSRRVLVALPPLRAGWRVESDALSSAEMGAEYHNELDDVDDDCDEDTTLDKLAGLHSGPRISDLELY